MSADSVRCGPARAPTQWSSAERAGLIALLMAAAALRLTGLGVEPFWIDEGMSLAYALSHRGLIDSLRFSISQDVHPPLYYAFLHVWGQFGDSEFFLRLPSVVFSVLTVWIIFSTLREHWGAVSAFAGGAAFAANAFSIWYAQELRSYSLVLLLSAWTFKYFLRFVAPGDRASARDAAWLVLATWLMLHSHNLTVFFWLGQGLFMLGWALLRGGEGWRSRPFRVWFAAQVVTTVLYLPWLFVFLRQQAAVSARFWVPRPTPFTVLEILHGFLTADSISLGGRYLMARLLVTVCLAGAVVAAAIAMRRDPRVAASVFCLVFPLAAAYGASVVSSPVLLDRTVVYSMVPLFMLLGAMTAERSPFGYRGNRRFPMRVAGLVLVAGLILINLRMWNYNRSNLQKEDFRGAADAVAKVADGKTAILFANAASQTSFDYYMKRRHSASPAREVAVPMHYLDIPPETHLLEPEVTPEAIERLGARLSFADKAILVVNETEFTDPRGLVQSYLGSHWELARSERMRGIELRFYERGESADS